MPASVDVVYLFLLFSIRTINTVSIAARNGLNIGNGDCDEFSVINNGRD